MLFSHAECVIQIHSLFLLSWGLFWEWKTFMADSCWLNFIGKFPIWHILFPSIFYSKEYLSFNMFANFTENQSGKPKGSVSKIMWSPILIHIF